MDPQIKSLLTTFGGYAATALVSWALTRGYVTPDQQAGVTTALTTLGGTLIAAGFAEYKRRLVTQTAMIKAVNAGDNGVTVVKTAAANAAAIPTASEPVKP